VVGELFEEAGVDPCFTIRRMDANVLLEPSALERNFDLARYRRAKGEAEQERRHRAESDALMWAHLWLMLTEG
jgi:hypothetical protein